MNNIIEFVSKHKVIIGVILLLLALVWVGYSSPLNKNIEGMDVPELDKFINKEVYLKFSKKFVETSESGQKETEEVNYLAVSPKGPCGIRETNDEQNAECHNNIAMLQPIPNKFCRMKLVKNFYAKEDEPKYMIKSTLDSLTPAEPALSQTKSNKVCFDFGDAEMVRFFMVPSNTGGYALKFRRVDEASENRSDVDNENQKKNYIFHYITECKGGKAYCNQGGETFKRLCTSHEAADAIYFNIELAPPTAEQIAAEEEQLAEEESLAESIDETVPLVAQESETLDYSIAGEEMDLYSLGAKTQDTDAKSVESMVSLEGFDANPPIGADINYKWDPSS